MQIQQLRIPEDPTHPSFVKFEGTDPKSDYKSILSLYLSEYATALLSESPACYGIRAENLKGKTVAEIKRMIIDRIAKNPNEVNDIAIG